MFRAEDFAPQLPGPANDVDETSGPLSRRIQALAVRYRAFDAAIEHEASRPRPDEDLLMRLKRTRLRIRDEVARLQTRRQAQSN